jgi:hypothetical protein
MSVRQAQEVAARLESLGVRWNGAFAGGPAATGDSVELPGGMRITLLSPAAADVSRFVDMWDAETQRGARSRPDEPQEDTSEKAIADTTAVERPVLYVTNAPEDDLWRARLLDACARSSRMRLCSPGTSANPMPGSGPTGPTGRGHALPSCSSVKPAWHRRSPTSRSVPWSTPSRLAIFS